MPLNKIKKTWDYCTYNTAFFVFVLFLYAIINIIREMYERDYTSIVSLVILMLCIILLYGYGLAITRDRANFGKRLPKIMPVQVFLLGVKGLIVFSVYLAVQGEILTLICSPFGFPVFDLESMLLHFQETVYLLYVHNSVDTVIFLFLGAIFFYITLFFMEIALARLADTGKLLSSFNLIAIKRVIDVVGWRNYTKECTAIIVAMVILSLIRTYNIPIDYLDYVVDVVLGLLIFAIQYLGIGAIYSQYKEKTKDEQ